MLTYGAGDEEALVILFQRYKLRIFNYFLRHLDDRAAAEDLLQSTFLKIHRVRKSYRPTAAFSTWVFTIATNLQRDYKLSARRHPHVVELEEVRVKAARGGGFSQPVMASSSTPFLATIRFWSTSAKRALILNSSAGTAFSAVT